MRSKGRTKTKEIPEMFVPGEDLVRMHSYGAYDVLQIWIPMLRSVNRKLAVNANAGAGRRLYITKEYREEETQVTQAIQTLVAKVKWIVAEDDHYIILYRFSFKMPTEKRPRTGDIHNPLKPVSDCLVAGGALYDDNNTRLEVVEKRNTPDKLHWAQIIILRFHPDSYPKTLLEEMLLDFIPTFSLKRKTA